MVEKKFSKYSWILSIIIGVFSVAFAFMPGNAVRKTAEIIRFMPNYDMYSVVDRFLLGICQCLNYLNNTGLLLVWTMSVLLTLFMFLNKQSILIKILSIVPATYYTLAAIRKWFLVKIPYSFDWFNKLFRLLIIDSVYFEYDKFSLAMTFVALVSAIILGSLLIIHTLDKTFDPIMPFFFFGGCGTVLLMGFSPTIYASGDRTCFIAELFFIFVVVIQLLEIKKMFVISPAFIGGTEDDSIGLK